MGRPRSLKINEVTEKEMNEHIVESNPIFENELESANSELDELRKELEKSKKELLESKISNAKRELDSKEIASISKSISGQNSRAGLKDKIESMCAHDSEPVTGKFMNLRAPGQSVKLCYAKYASDQDKWTNFEHNSKYTIPRGFADQINDHYAKITYDRSNEQNQALESTPRREQMYAFVSQNY